MLKKRRRERGHRNQNGCSSISIPEPVCSLLNPKSDPAFLVQTPPETIRREKEKAAALRKSQWWQRKLAKGECHYCRSKVAPEDLTMDHLVPLIRGGPSTRGNLVPACKSCNNRKKYLLPVEWEEYLKGLINSTSSKGPTQ